MDTEVLMGRIYGWEGEYETAMEILERAVQKYPVYEDAYSALLDIYFWSGQNYKVPLLERKLKLHNINSGEIRIKVKRAHDILKENAVQKNMASQVPEAMISKFEKGL